jgi:hypothetical protein
VLSDEHLLQALCAAGVQGRNVVYVSAAITSGRREVNLLQKLGLHSPEALRNSEPELWRHEVMEANERDALANATLVREAQWVLRGHIVVDPSRMFVKGWDQDDYNHFWVRMMSEHVRYLVATPGWECSRGARTEVGYALTFSPAQLAVVDMDGSPLGVSTITSLAEAARAALFESGWSPQEVDSYLAPLALARPNLAPSPQSQTFDWLIDERRYQVRRFGSASDDQHLREDALDEDGWWSTQLQTYLERARAADPSDPAARTELAKFAATAVAAMESAIRVHGPIPRPPSRREP